MTDHGLIPTDARTFATPEGDYTFKATTSVFGDARWEVTRVCDSRHVGLLHSLAESPGFLEVERRVAASGRRA